MTRVEHISEELNHELRRANEEKRTREIDNSKINKNEKLSSDTAAQKTSKDTVNISQYSKTLLQQKNEINQYVEKIQNIRFLNEKSIEEIQDKINSGYYSKPGILDKITEVIIDLPIVRNILKENPGKTESLQSQKEKSEKLSEVCSKIKDGVYDSDEVLEYVVERLINSNIL